MTRDLLHFRTTESLQIEGSFWKCFSYSDDVFIHTIFIQCYKADMSRNAAWVAAAGLGRRVVDKIILV